MQANSIVVAQLTNCLGSVSHAIFSAD